MAVGSLSEDCRYITDGVLSIIFSKYLPFIVHFSLTASVATVFLLGLDGKAFNTNSRRPEYKESDGSISRLSSYALLQSDITTAISLAATVTRIAGGWWSGGYIWRCIFVSMERGGISLKGVSRIISGIPIPPRNLTQRSNWIIIFITLFGTFSMDYFSAALTGSVVWEHSNRLIPGRIPVTGIKKGVPGGNMSNYFIYPDWQDRIQDYATASASLAWLTDSTNAMDRSTIFRRILDSTQYLPVNSTLNEVIIPYFVVDDFEWIKDPDSVLTHQQLPLFHNLSKPGPYFTLAGIGGLLPDREWGPPETRELGDPVVVLESRLFTFRVSQQPEPCPQNYTIDPRSEVNLHQAKVVNDYNCYAIANVTYQAGVARCKKCNIISPTVLQAQGPLQVIPDSLTPVALGLTAMIGTCFRLSEYAAPPNDYTNQSFAIDLTSRAYQTAWSAFAYYFGNPADETAVQIALPTLRAKVNPWRVYLWVGLHLSLLTLGLLFIYIQSRCSHPWVEDTTMAVFWLNTSAVSLQPDGQRTDPWRSGVELPKDRVLILEDAGERSRSVKIKED